MRKPDICASDCIPRSLSSSETALAARVLLSRLPRDAGDRRWIGCHVERWLVLVDVSIWRIRVLKNEDVALYDNGIGKPNGITLSAGRDRLRWRRDERECRWCGGWHWNFLELRKMRWPGVQESGTRFPKTCCLGGRMDVVSERS